MFFILNARAKDADTLIHSEILKLSKIAHLKVLIEQTQIEKSSERFRICVLENLFWDFLNMPVNNST